MPRTLPLAGMAALLLTGACGGFDGNWAEAAPETYTAECGARFATNGEVPGEMRRFCACTGTQLSRKFESLEAFRAAKLTPGEQREIFADCNFSF